MQRETRPDDKKKEEVPGSLPVQRAAMEEGPLHDEKPVQASRTGGAGGATPAPAPSMETAASQAISSKGPGEPLNAATRDTLESRMGTDLSDVRVHNDSRAQEAAGALNARAFTHQSDIWLGQGESQHNLQLMAHEATHVVQQTGSVHRQLVQRATPKATGGSGTPPAAPGGTGAAPATGTAPGTIPAKITDTEIEIQANINLPSEAGKSKIPTPVKVRKDEREETDQREKWKKEISGAGVSSEVDAMLPDSKGIESQLSKKKIFYLKLKGEKSFLIGEREQLKKRLLLPNWTPAGKHSPLTVDHRHELQLGGPHALENFQLLEQSANFSAGSLIKAEIYRKITAAVQPGPNKTIPPDMPKNPKEIRQKYQVSFTGIGEGPKLAGRPNERYEKDDVAKEGKHLEGIEVLGGPQVDEYKIREDPTKLKIFLSAGAGAPKEIPWEPNISGKDVKRKNFGGAKGFNVTHVDYKPESSGKIFGNVFDESKVLIKKDFEVDLIEDAQYITRIDGHALRTRIGQLRARGFSPVEIFDTDIGDDGLVARGILRADLPLFKDLQLDLTISGGDISLSKTFNSSDFKFPGPIHVTDASLTLSAGTGGFSVSGDVLFEIDRVGKGKLSGKGQTTDGFFVSGDFEFDTDLFDPAKVHVEYKDGKFSGAGHLGIKAGKVRGIKSASIEASFSEDVIDAKGSITPDIPAVEQANLAMHYDPKTGLSISGDLQLKKDIPGIAGGSIHAEVTKKDEKYTVKASGEATPKISGISSKLTVTYDDGAFDATVTAGYEKGMLKGSVTVGATNRPVDDTGKPGAAPAAKGDNIVIYGSGSVTLKLAPWLQATAAVKFKPNGEVEVTGKIGLPAAINLFDEKKVEQNIFKIGIDIPILGFSVLGQRVGIFLTIGGGLDLSAGIGPGQLQDLSLSVTYNPAHEEDTQVHGHAALHIPAHAGLRMSVHAALGAGIPIVSAQAGIELGGSLGVEGALDAGVDVDWSPKKGLVLDAKASISAEPKFKFDITGYVLVEADLLFTTITLYEKKWQLAAVEYGSGLRLGMKLPIHYEEGKPFNVSLSDIEFEKPKVDAMSVLKGLLDKIK